MRASSGVSSTGSHRSSTASHTTSTAASGTSSCVAFDMPLHQTLEVWFGAMAAMAPVPPRQQQPQPGSSKYDYVKVRVRLSERHYYVLSRFLVSRVLTATKVCRTHAPRRPCKVARH
jgi:hypothetical protein